MSSDSFQLMGMAERGMLPIQFTHRSRFGTPTLAIIFSASGVLLLSVLSFTEVIEVLNFLYCFAQLLEFSAFITLRQKRADLVRPYKAPVNTAGAVALLALPSTMVLILIAMSSWITWLCGGLLTILGLVLYPILMWAKKNQFCSFVSEDERKHSGVAKKDLFDGLEFDYPIEERQHFLEDISLEGGDKKFQKAPLPNKKSNDMEGVEQIVNNFNSKDAENDGTIQ